MTNEVALQSNWIDGLPETARKAMTDAMVSRVFGRGTLIFSRTEMPEGLYLVREGTALFCLDSENGSRLLLKIIRPNDFFGGIASYDGRSATVSVEARSNLSASLIPMQRVTRLRFEHPSIDQALADQTARNLRGLLDVMEEVVLMPLRERTKACLARLVRETASNVLDITQAELGAMLGASRQAVNAVLGEMVKEGLVILRFKSIICCAAMR